MASFVRPALELLHPCMLQCGNLVGRKQSFLSSSLWYVCSYDGFFMQPDLGHAQAEDEDAFAHCIWQEMEKGKRLLVVITFVLFMQLWGVLYAA